MKIKFYGTAGTEGIPGIFCKCEVCKNSRVSGGRNIRTRTQTLVDDTLLIDFPADTYFHVLYYGLPLADIHHCVITHSHGDHFYPTDLAMRGGKHAHGLAAPLNVYGTRAVKARLGESNPQPKENAVICQEISAFVPFEAAGFRITPLTASHHPESDPVFYLIEKAGKAIMYANDTGYFLDDTWRYLENISPKLNFVSFDCTFGINTGPNNRHMGLPGVIEVRKRLKEMGCVSDETLCFLNHFSHNYFIHDAYDEITEAASEYGFKVTWDGLEVEF